MNLKKIAKPGCGATGLMLSLIVVARTNPIPVKKTAFAGFPSPEFWTPAGEAAQEGETSDWQQAALAQVKKRIAGRESEPAEQVFKNIDIFEGLPASRLPGAISALKNLGRGREQVNTDGAIGVPARPFVVHFRGRARS